MMAEDDNHHFGAVDETTKRLVGRCGRVAWLKDEEVSGLSPTWVKQRLLGVDMPSAMESSLSVVEVTTQMEKPGVKTPSRANDDKVNENSGNKTESSGTGNSGTSGAVAAVNDGVGKTMDVQKSPFEVEGEA